MLNILRICLALFCFPSVCSYSEDVLIKKLFNDDYNRDARPVVNATDQVKVEVKLSMHNLHNVDERDQILTAFLWIEMFWDDPRLTWNPAEHGMVQEIAVHNRNIWTPDLVILNSPAKAYEILQDENNRVKVNYNGSVKYFTAGSIPVACIIDLTYFPYDEQSCYFEIASRTYEIHALELFTDDGEILVDSSNQQWEVVSTNASLISFYSPGGDRHHSIIFSLNIMRKPTYYTNVLVFPCTILSIISLLMFCLPADGGDKISLGITVLLSFSVFQLLIADIMPRTSDQVPLLAIYVVAVMILTSISLVLTTVVISMHNLDEANLMSKVFRFVTFKVLAKILCMDCFIKKQNRNKNVNGNELQDYTIMADAENENISKSSSNTPHTWVYAARVWDRLFFWICLVALIILWITVFIVAKHYRKPAQLTLIDSLQIKN